MNILISFLFFPFLSLSFGGITPTLNCSQLNNTGLVECVSVDSILYYQSSKLIEVLALDCSPYIDYNTRAEEQHYCRLQQQNPDCRIWEDFSKTCNK